MTLNLELLVIHLEKNNVPISDKLRFAALSPCIEGLCIGHVLLPYYLDPKGIIIALLFDIFGILKFKELACNVHICTHEVRPETYERSRIMEFQRTQAQDKRERRFYSDFHFGERVVKDPRKTW